MSRQFSTFYINHQLYGIDVSVVQEITKPMPITEVPLAPEWIKGLINLRGQIATAIGLRELFHLQSAEDLKKGVNVVCKADGILMALLVDEVGDVLEVTEDLFESTPEVMDPVVKEFLEGVFKLPDHILSIIDTKKLIHYLNQPNKG